MPIKLEDLNKYLPSPISIEESNKIINQMENCICKIYKDNIPKGIGFFCKIPFKNKLLHALITNNHNLNEKDIENNKSIKIDINKKIKEIKIDKSRIKYSLNEFNITIIEIKPNRDKIYEQINFMELDVDIKKNYLNKSIYILQFQKRKICVSYSLIIDLINEKINYNFNNEEDLFGCPILSLENFKIIGIHIGNSKICDKKIK